MPRFYAPEYETEEARRARLETAGLTQDTAEEVDRKQRMLRRSIRDKAVVYKPNNELGIHLEAILSLGDRRLEDAIELVWQRGQTFDSWDEYLDYNRWMQTLTDSGIDIHYFANRHKSYDEPLPWDHIDCGVTKAYLRAEDKKSRSAKFTNDCHTEPCTFCNACDRAYTESAGFKKGNLHFVPNAVAMIPLTPA